MQLTYFLIMFPVSTNDGVGFAHVFVEMLKNVVEGISPGHVDVSRLEGHAMLDGAHGYARSDRRSRSWLRLDSLERRVSGQVYREAAIVAHNW